MKAILNRKRPLIQIKSNDKDRGKIFVIDINYFVHEEEMRNKKEKELNEM
jgi:hypothetical protein